MSAASGERTGDVDVFERARPRLLGVAYRMLGTVADAEDVVQEAWLRWDSADTSKVQRPDAWLTTVTTRLALDRLRANRRRREDYVGPWLPEPVVTTMAAPDLAPDESAELAESLTFGFLAILDRLQPLERAVLLLVDVFGVPYSEVADTVGKSDVACRQIASRARRRVRDQHLRAPSGHERRIVDEFLVAVALGDVDGALARAAPDVVCINDGGALRRAARHPVVGAHRVVRLFVNLARRHADEARYEAAIVNGDPGLIVYVGDEVDFVAAFEVEDDRVAAVWVVRNPEKLEHVLEPVALA